MMVEEEGYVEGDDVTLGSVQSTDFKTFPLASSRPNRKTSGFNCSSLRNCWERLHYAGWTPYTYHVDDQDVPHYKATIACTTLLTLIILAAAGYHFKSAHDQEQQWWDGLDEMFHDIAAGATLGLISAVGAAFLTAVSICIFRRHYFLQSPQSGISMSRDQFDKLGLGSTRVMALIGRRDYGNLEPQEGRSCSPMNLIRPWTPQKTFGSLLTIFAVGFVVGSILDPDFFNEIANSDYGHFGAVVTASLTMGGAAALFQAGYHGCKKYVYNSDDGCLPTHSRAPSNPAATS